MKTKKVIIPSDNREELPLEYLETEYYGLLIVKSKDKVIGFLLKDVENKEWRFYRQHVIDWDYSEYDLVSLVKYLCNTYEDITIEYI